MMTAPRLSSWPTSALWGSYSSKQRPWGEKYWHIQLSLLQHCLCHLASCPWTHMLVFLGHFLSHLWGKFWSPHGSAVRPAKTTLQFKWNSCISVCQHRCSFEAGAPFGGKKKKKSDHKRSVTLQGTELFRMPATRDGELPVPVSCVICSPCLGPGRLDIQIPLMGAVRILIVWGFFFPKSQNCLKNKASDLRILSFQEGK